MIRGKVSYTYGRYPAGYLVSIAGYPAKSVSVTTLVTPLPLRSFSIHTRFLSRFSIPLLFYFIFCFLTFYVIFPLPLFSPKAIFLCLSFPFSLCSCFFLSFSVSIIYSFPFLVLSLILFLSSFLIPLISFPFLYLIYFPFF